LLCFRPKKSLVQWFMGIGTYLLTRADCARPFPDSQVGSDFILVS
jgi:hypothetical protein